MFELLTGVIVGYPLLISVEVVFTLLACGCLSNRRYGWTASLTLVGLATGMVLSGVPILPFLRDNYITLFEYLFGFVVIGITYSLIRYLVFMIEVSHDLSTFCKERKIERSAIPEKDMNFFQKSHHIRDIPLRMRDYADDMFIWAIFWPISALTLVVEKPIKWVQRGAQAIMQAISDKLFGDVKVVPAPLKDDTSKH